MSEPADKKLQQENAWKTLAAHLSVISTIFSRSAAAHVQQHAEERDALALLASFATPSFHNTITEHNYILNWARSLLQRGAADVNAHATDGYTPVQNWCNHSKLMSAKGILLLLEAGADFDATHPEGWTALYQLCHFSRLQVLRELSEAGWLEMANIDLPGVGGEMPIAYLQRKLREKPDDADVAEMLELLSAQKKLWRNSVRSAVSATLTSHEQLIPELAELVVSYIDGGKEDAAAAPSAAAAAAAASS